VNQENGDLVVMGTKGSSGINAVIYGSVASSVVRNTIVPVLSIPPDSKFDGIKKMVYATDGGEVKDNSVLEPIRDFQKHFGSDVTVFSVEKEEGSLHLESMNLNLEGAHYASVVDKDVQAAIGNYCENENADLLVLLPKHTGFFDRIFHKSITRKIVEKADMPILSLENR
jgi:nucleotide-binding universal stress UspA family protein